MITARLRIALQRLAKLARALQGVGLAKRVVVKGPALEQLTVLGGHGAWIGPAGRWLGRRWAPW